MAGTTPAVTGVSSETTPWLRAGTLSAQLDENLVAPVAQRDPGLLGGEAHDDAVVVLKPEFAVREGGDGEIAVALDPCARELRDVAEFIDLARRLRRCNGADAVERADERERVAPAPEGEGSAADPRSGDEDLVMVTLPDGLAPRIRRVGTPEGGISQPASGRDLPERSPPRRLSSQ